MSAIHDLTTWWQYEQGGTMRGLAKALDVTPATLYYWLREDEVPLKHLKKISDLTHGEFPKERLRPDIFK